ncbi:MAG TPA: serine hydrolase domain-containing protein [Myxococcota bacterium]|nr:serine hydrolase domain-containing protein [Myxococcota bacterium]
MRETRAPGVRIEGRVSKGFEPVREAFAHNFEAHGEVGAAVCVLRDGEPVVDLWGGLADPATRRAWERDTMALVFSTTKGVTAACIARLAERGVIDVEAPVARYWPEFAANGKAEIRVSDVMTHRAGLAEVEGRFTLEEACAADAVCAALAKQAPQWPPCSAHGYHARTYGWILGEVVRRATGERFGAVLAREIAAPLGLEYDLFVGLPARYDARVARTLPAPAPTDPKERELRERFMGPDSRLGRVLSGPSNLFEYGDMWNTRLLRGAEMPSSNGIATARALARVYASLVGPVDGVRLLSPETVARFRAPQVDGPDLVILVPTRFGLGFALPPMLSPEAPASCFGHPGAGGSLAFADPDSRIGFGYAMNQMQLGLTGDARAASLVRAIYASLRRPR